MTNGSNEPGGHEPINFSVVTSILWQRSQREMSQHGGSSDENPSSMGHFGLWEHHSSVPVSVCHIVMFPRLLQLVTAARKWIKSIMSQERWDRVLHPICVQHWLTHFKCTCLYFLLCATQFQSISPISLIKAWVCKNNNNNNNNRKGLFILDRCNRWAVHTVKKSKTLEESKHPMSHRKASQSTLRNHRENKLVPPEQCRVTAAWKNSPARRKLERTSSLEGGSICFDRLGWKGT